MLWQKSSNEQLIEALKAVMPSKKELAINGNITVESLSKLLTWDQFEKLTALIVESNGFSVNLNYRIGRREIDVLAHNGRYLLGIDCKHWKRMSGSAISRAAQMQKERVRLALRSFKELRGIAVIVTLYDGGYFLINGVPVVPIDKLIGFLNELDGYINQLDVMGP